MARILTAEAIAAITKKKACALLFVIVLPTLIGITTIRIMSIQFDRACSGYLKRAADSNTIETASEQLAISLAHLDGLIKDPPGYTSILWRTPDEDVGFWVKNLKQAQSELIAMIADENASSLETSNQLIKLRETLLDTTEHGDNITVPDGMSRYPHNRRFALFFVFALLWAALLFVVNAEDILEALDS